MSTITTAGRRGRRAHGESRVSLPETRVGPQLVPNPSPPFARALEALSAILAQHGRSRMAAWARTADDDETRICAVLFENTTLAVALLRDLDRAHRSGNPKRVAKVRRRLDRVLDMIETRHE